MNDWICCNRRTPATHMNTALSQNLPDYLGYRYKVSVPVAARSKAWVYGRSPAEIVGSNPTGGMDVCLV